jgi:hypothetical protein
MVVLQVSLGWADVTFSRMRRDFRTGMDRVTRTPLSLPLPHNQVDTDTLRYDQIYGRYTRSSRL